MLRSRSRELESEILERSEILENRSRTRMFYLWLRNPGSNSIWATRKILIPVDSCAFWQKMTTNMSLQDETWMTQKKFGLK